MITVIALLFLLIVLDIAAMRWGFTSSDGLESKEWERRQQHAWLRNCSQTQGLSILQNSVENHCAAEKIE